MPAFDTNHPLSWHFAQQTFRIGIVSKSGALLQESFIAQEANKEWMLDRIKQLPIEHFVFPFSHANNKHRQWAALSYGIGFWGMPPPTFNCWKEVWIDFAAEEVRRGIAKLKSDINGGPAVNQALEISDEINRSPSPNVEPGPSGVPSTEPADDTTQVLGMRKRQTKAEEVDQNQVAPTAIQRPTSEKDSGNGYNVFDKANDLSVTIYHRSQLCSSDIVHLNDLLKSVFHNWHTDRPVSETGPQVPSLHQKLSHSNRAQVGVLNKALDTRLYLRRATGDPVYYYGANSRGMATSNYCDTNGQKVPDYAVTVKGDSVKEAIAEIKENWRTRAEPRLKQHDIDELVWMARHRLYEWYHKNGITWGSGTPIYNKVDLPEFEAWTI